MTLNVTRSQQAQPGECFHCWLRIHHAATICHQCAVEHDATALLVTEWENIYQTANAEAQQPRKGRKYLDKASNTKRIQHDHQHARRVKHDLQDITKLLHQAKHLNNEN